MTGIYHGCCNGTLLADSIFFSKVYRCWLHRNRCHDNILFLASITHIGNYGTALFLPCYLTHSSLYDFLRVYIWFK
jgi:hypothetical protein